MESNKFFFFFFFFGFESLDASAIFISMAKTDEHGKNRKEFIRKVVRANETKKKK